MTADPSTPENQPKPAGMRTWLKIVLVISLALNVLVAGAVVTKFAFGHKHFKRFGGHVSVVREGRRFVRSLPRERRRELRSLASRYAAEHKSGFVTARHLADEGRLALAGVLEAGTLDRTALAGAVAKLAGAAGAAAKPVGEILIKMVEQLTPGERRAFAARLRKAKASHKP